jgi:hypothetical protein
MCFELDNCLFSSDDDNSVEQTERETVWSTPSSVSQHIPHPFVDRLTSIDIDDRDMSPDPNGHFMSV